MQTSIQFKDAPFPGIKCARELQLPNWSVIEECANSTQGSKLLQDYGERTKQLNPQLTEVPTITFNHVSRMGILACEWPFVVSTFKLYSNFLHSFSKPTRIWWTLGCATCDPLCAVWWENPNHKNATICQTLLNTTAQHSLWSHFALQFSLFSKCFKCPSQWHHSFYYGVLNQRLNIKL